MTRPRVLWVPHTPWSHCPGQRPAFLVDRLRGRFEVHVVTWALRPPDDPRGGAFYLDPRSHWRALSRHDDVVDGVQVHHLGLPLPVVQQLWKRYPADWVVALSQRRFQAGLFALHERLGFQAAVLSASHHFTGYPARLPGVPAVFDYVDASPPHVERAYLALAEHVVTVSHHLADAVQARHGREARVIPNGLDLARMRAGDGRAARARWGLGDRRVVSLIGLTCSPRLYFLEALAEVQREHPDLVFLAVGGGAMADRIARRCGELGVRAILTGWLPPDQMPDLFAASDVGLYPGDDHPYYDGALPLKVLEYTGAGVPVVVNRAAELVRLGFPSLHVRDATAAAFADGLRQALREPSPRVPGLEAYDWSRLADAFGGTIDHALGARAA